LRTSVALAAFAALDLEQPIEQRARREPGVQTRDRVQVGALIARSDRFGLVDTRRHHVAHAAQCAQRREARAQMALAVAEVRAERDVRHLIAGASARRAAQVSDRAA
jgi:hypothetical protein